MPRKPVSVPSTTTPIKTTDSVASTSVLEKKVVLRKRKVRENSVILPDPSKDRAGQAKDSLEELGVNVGGQTQRERLLQLLNRHVTRKTPRLSDTCAVPDITRKKGSKMRNPVPTPTGPVQDLKAVENRSLQYRHPDYARFSDAHLIEMIGGVGIDAKGFDRTKLINTCRTYNDLIIIPDTIFDFTVSEDVSKTRSKDVIQPSVVVPLEAGALASIQAGNQSRAQTDIGLWVVDDVSESVGTGATKTDVGFLAVEDVSEPVENPSSGPPSRIDSNSQTTLPNESRRSSLVLRSEVGTSISHKKDHQKRVGKAPPKRSNLRSSQVPQTRSRKGKEKALAPESEPESFPDVNISDESGNENMNHESQDKPSDPSDRPGTSSGNYEETVCPPQTPKRPSVQPHRIDLTSNPSPETPQAGSNAWLVHSIYKIQAHLARTDKNFESLSQSFNSLSDVVSQNIENSPTKRCANKTRGGQLAAQIRFHVETLIGNQDSNEKLPPPATASERESWMCEVDPINIEADSVRPSVSTGQSVEPSNPRFPYPKGPGHQESTPQQLSVIWNMMQSVGVSSFRPDFSQSATSNENRWLWDLCLQIFIKLVECGEYTGVSLQEQNRTFMKKTLHTHIRSLTKRYQNEQWSEERRKRTADEVRRTSRLRYLRGLRENIVLSQQALWPLAPIVRVACSDDETDMEQTTSGNNSVGPSIPCCIRSLEWRSQTLESVCILLDSSKSKSQSSTPRSRTRPSPKTTGRRCRPRVRCDSKDRPKSQIPVPARLPIDCYSKKWLTTLSPLERREMEINPVPLLIDLIPKLEKL